MLLFVGYWALSWVLSLELNGCFYQKNNTAVPEIEANHVYTQRIEDSFENYLSVKLISSIEIFVIIIFIIINVIIIIRHWQAAYIEVPPWLCDRASHKVVTWSCGRGLFRRRFRHYYCYLSTWLNWSPLRGEKCDWSIVSFERSSNY